MSNNEKSYNLYIVKLNVPRQEGALMIAMGLAGWGSYEDCVKKMNEIRSYSEYLDATISDGHGNVVEPNLFRYEVSQDFHLV